MEVLVFRGKAAGHIDNRREIKDTSLEEAVELPFKLVQIKLINLFAEAVIQRLAVGNHYHTEESGRYEFYVVYCEGSQEPSGLLEPACLFRFRKAGEGELQEIRMMAGDACLIPPGNSHAFLPLRAGVQILGLSNLKYDSGHDVTDKLF